MHHHVDVVVGDVEEQMRLDDLESLVDQRRRVGRDHPSHVPGRMRQGFRGRHSGQLGTAPASERTSGCGDDEPPHLVVPAAAQRLGDGGVLRVDRDDLPGCGSGEHEFSADDQRFLVCERERATCFQSCECGAEADRAGDRIEDDIRLDIAHQLLGLHRSERGVLHLELRRLVAEHLSVAAGCEPDEFESTRVRTDDLQRLSADGTCGPEDDDATHVASLLATAERPWWRGCRRRRRGSPSRAHDRHSRRNHPSGAS